MQAWRVTGDGVAESRFRALRGTDLIPLVGREHELTMLLDRWEQASDGEGQVVLIVGEPGIGKSRLVQALRDRLTASSHIYVGCYCSAHRMDSPLQPIIAYLERAANFAHDEDPGQRLTKLETLLARVNKETKELVPLIAPLLSISSEGRYSAPRISPQLQRERTLTTLVDQLVRLSSRRTVLLVCEDVHWADATSLELLRLVIDRVQILPVLALITFRPGFVPTWPSLSHVTGLMLNRLSRRRCDQIIAAMTPGKSMPKPIVERILAYADGVPLFVEELTKQVLEAELLRKEEDHFELVGPLSPVAIPTTLQDSLMARLDRLGPAKEIAQIASVIGRESPRELLAAVVPQEADLPDGLHRLALAELVFRRGTEPQITYVFKHVLVRDAAYASLLSARRRELHCTIAQTLEEHFTHVAEGEPDVLAHHWAEAGAAEKAAEYRRKAGEKALTHSAITEAIAQLLLGKSLLQNLPEGEGRWRRELELQIPMGAALSAAKGMAAEETVKAYERAHELCDLLGEEQRRIPVLLGLWGSYNARDELGLAHRAAAQLLQSAEQRQNETASVLGHRALGATLFQIGEFASAKTHLQRLLELDSTRAGIFSVALPYDPFISGRAWLSLTLSVLGYCDQALVQAAKALADAEHLQHQNTQALVLSLRCSLGQYLRDHQAVERHAKALLALAVERGFAYWVGLATYFQGWARAGTTDVSAGIAEMRRGLAACQTTGAQAYVPYNLALLADTCRIAGDPLLGRELLNEALAQLDQTEARYCESELLCIDGELRLSMPQADLPEAVRLFRRAIEIARRKNARTTELRATTHLAQLMADSGDRREAYNLLAPAYAWFTEGFDTRYLVDAKALLNELAKEAT
jgi:predicted ATPase